MASLSLSVQIVFYEPDGTTELLVLDVETPERPREGSHFDAIRLADGAHFPGRYRVVEVADTLHQCGHDYHVKAVGTAYAVH